MTNPRDWTQSPVAKRVAAARPDLFSRFADLQGATFRPAALDGKTKELIAIAVTLTTQCEGCISLHARSARLAGATDDEIVEALFIAMELRAGAAFSHFRIVTAALDEVDAELAREASARAAE